MPTSHLIQGREVTLPVHVREASACTASYLVRADAARAVIAYSGLDVLESPPGKTVCTLVFVRYTDGDLGAYHEFAVTFLVRPPDSHPLPGSRLRRALEITRGRAAFVHWLPVNQGFTLEAGQTIWGFPKEMADIDLRLSSPYKRCIVRKDERTVIDLLIRPGIPVPGGRPLRASGVTHRLSHGTRRVPFEMRPYGLRARPGGALLRLGNHPVAKELEELGLPKQAILSTSIARLQMTIEGAV